MQVGLCLDCLGCALQSCVAGLLQSLGRSKLLLLP